MKRFLTVALPVAALVLVAGVAFAQMGGGMMGGMSGGMGGMMGGAPDGAGSEADCHAAAAAAPELTDEQVREIAEQYVAANLPGFSVETVKRIDGMHMTMYSVETKNAANEIRVLHVNPWGQVMSVMSHDGSAPRV